MNKKNGDNIVKLLAILLIIAIFVGIHWLIPSFYHTIYTLASDHDVHGLVAYISSFGNWAFFLVIVLIVLTNMTGLPSVEFVAVSGVIFGFVPGIIVSWIGQCIGNIASFFILRYIFRDAARSIIAKSRRLSRFNSHINFKLIFFLRAIPFAPNLIITALCALSPASGSAHAGGTILGKFLAVCMEVWLGYDLLHLNPHGLIPAGIILLILAFSLFGDKIFNKKKFNKELTKD